MKEGPEKSRPSLLLFDSNDGRAYSDERKMKDLHYFEYGEIWFDGKTAVAGARDMQTTVRKTEEKGKKRSLLKKSEYIDYTVEAVRYKDYTVEAVRYKDHAMVTIEGNGQAVEVIIAMPDSTRFLYLGLTGQYCRIADVRIEKSEEEIGEGYIRRIAEEISYIKGPAGDVPNVQIDTYRSDATEGIPVVNGMKISFHSMSLPTATLIWHCPFITIFHSDDGLVNGEGYREFALIRIDGEYWETDNAVRNDIIVRKKDSFIGWEEWKEQAKKGIDCEVTFTRKGNTITTVTENMGIYIKNVTVLSDDDTKDIYAALTGDQVALTDIRIADELEQMGLNSSEVLAVMAFIVSFALIFCIIWTALRIFLLNPLEIGCHSYLKENIVGEVTLNKLGDGFVNYKRIADRFLVGICSGLWFCLLFILGW